MKRISIAEQTLKKQIDQLRGQESDIDRVVEMTQAKASAIRGIRMGLEAEMSELREMRERASERERAKP